MHYKRYISDQANVGLNYKQKCKFVKFVTFYHLLKHGHPITNYKNMKESFDFLQVLNNFQTSLEWRECLENGWMHAKFYAHKNTINHSINKVYFNVYWWNHHYGLPKVDWCSCLCDWRLEMHTHLLMLEQLLSNVITNNLPKVIVTKILQYGNFS